MTSSTGELETDRFLYLGRGRISSRIRQNMALQAKHLTDRPVGRLQHRILMMYVRVCDVIV